MTAQYVPYQGRRIRSDGRSTSWSFTPPGSSEASENTLQATPFIYRPPDTLPRRQWLYGRHYIRRFVSGTVATGGMGKSALVLVEALAMATGRDLLGHRPRGKFRVWYLNLEDPLDEIERRVGGILIRYGISDQEIEGHLFINSGRDRDFTLVTTTRNGVEIQEKLCEEIETEITARGIDVLIIDPLISALRIAENDNNAMDVAIKRLARIAENTNCAVEVLHHTRKASPNDSAEPSIDDARGASSFGGAVRVGRVLRRMTKKEAEKAGVQNHEQHFRAHLAKANMSPRLDQSEWYQLQSGDLGNDSPKELSDQVGVVTRWEWPDLCEALGQYDLYRVQQAVSRGPGTILSGDAHVGWRRDPQAPAWAGKAVAHVLGLSPEHDKPQIKRLIETWIASGALRVVRKLDQRRKEKEFVVVGEWMPAPADACSTLQNGSGAMVEQVEQ
jgi:RecA/RadA recombinase